MLRLIRVPQHARGGHAYQAARGGRGAFDEDQFGARLGRSVGKLELAASCGMPLGAKLLSAKLLTRAARLGQLEHLRWLHAHGCAWEPCERWQEGPCSSAAEIEGSHLSVLGAAAAACTTCLTG
jgi:hypothetical protein